MTKISRPSRVITALSRMWPHPDSAQARQTAARHVAGYRQRRDYSDPGDAARHMAALIRDAVRSRRE